MIENINLNYVDYDYFNSLEFIDKYKEMIEGSGFLQKGIYRGNSLKGLFSENLWVYQAYITKYYIYIDFSNLQNFKVYGLTTEYIDLIKCWIADTLMTRAYKDSEEDINLSARVKTHYEHLVEFIEVSKNFSLDFIEDTNGSLFEEYFFNFNSESMAKAYSKDILSFINFIENKFIEDKQEIAIEYINKLTYVFESVNIKKQSRELPNSRDILLFDNYVDLFFNSDKTPFEVKMYFYPINLWWKLTNVIPLRPSEFCLKLKRNSLLEREDGYYLKIDRVKKNQNIGANVLPVLNELKITKEIYDMIKDYIEKTDLGGISKTLISYPALIHYRRKLKEHPVMNYSKLNTLEIVKQTQEYFTITTFSLLLYSFYNVVIKGIFKDEIIKERVRPNDTRHFAFTSLILQGVAPEKIAILGGHRNLATLDNYTCSNNTYIDSEVITIIQKNLSEGEINRSKIKKIVLEKNESCPKPYSECFKTEIEGVQIGYCTADLNDNIPCKDDDCCYCDKWWCSPSEENYITLFDIIINKIKREENKLNRDIKFIKSLFRKINIVDINGNFFIDKDIEKQFRQSSLSINRDTKRLIELKSQLISGQNKKEIIGLLEGVNKQINEVDINYLEGEYN